LQGIANEASWGWLKLGSPAIHAKKTNASPKGAEPQARAPTRGRLSKLGPARKGLDQRHFALAIY
jgi:hypothetical protein